MSAPAQPNRLWRLVESPIFTGVILAVIIANAVVLGLQTYDEIEEQHGDTLDLLNAVFLGIFGLPQPDRLFRPTDGDCDLGARHARCLAQFPQSRS